MNKMNWCVSATGVFMFGLLSFTAIVPATVRASNCDDVAQYADVKKADLKSMIQNKTAFIVDVNSESSFKKNHIDTAIHYGTNKNTFADVLPKDKNMQIIAYCGGPKCTAWQKAAKEACKLGYAKISHFKGGISGWLATNE